jgi:hypothetical protein
MCGIRGGDLANAVRTGENSFRSLHGTDVWEWRADHPEESAIFDEAMTSLTAASNAAILAAYDFGRLGRSSTSAVGTGPFSLRYSRRIRRVAASSSTRSTSSAGPSRSCRRRHASTTLAANATPCSRPSRPRLPERARALPVRGQGSSHLESFDNRDETSRPRKRTAGATREEFVMEYHRKQAKALVRAYRAGEQDAVRRVDAVLGGRAQQRFLLSDAQHVVAREQGHRSWQELKRAHDDAPEWVDGEEVLVPTDLVYAPDEPVDIVVRKRGWRFDISDGARAVELAGRPDGWQDVAEQVVETYWINVNRRGVVFVQSNEYRLEWLIGRVAECSVVLYQELLERS